MNNLELLYGNFKHIRIAEAVKHPFDINAEAHAFTTEKYTAIFCENPDDGYRSSAELIIGGEDLSYTGNWQFYRGDFRVEPWVKSEYGEGAEGIQIINADNNLTILLAGTDNCNDYYPSYTWDWKPENLTNQSE